MIKRRFSQSTQDFKPLYGANLEESCSNVARKKTLSVALFSIIVSANILLFLASTVMWFSETEECEKHISASCKYATTEFWGFQYLHTHILIQTPYQRLYLTI